MTAIAFFSHRFHLLSDNLKGALLLMLAAIGFSLMVALIKLLGERLHVTQILFLRQAGMTLIILPTLARNFPSVLRSQRPALQFARICCALVAMLAGFSAVIHLPLAEATALGFAKSFFVTIFAILILREAVSGHRWGATAAGFIGVLLMLRPGTEGFSLYGLYAVIGAAAAGMVMVIIRLLSRCDAPSTILFYQAVGVGLIMAIPGILFWQPPTPTEWLLIALTGLVSYYAQTLNIYAYKWGEASLMASLDYVRLLYATALGYWLFDDLPGFDTWFGAAIIMAASLYALRYGSARLPTRT